MPHACLTGAAAHSKATNLSNHVVSESTTMLTTGILKVENYYIPRLNPVQDHWQQAYSKHHKVGFYYDVPIVFKCFKYHVYRYENLIILQGSLALKLWMPPQFEAIDAEKIRRTSRHRFVEVCCTIDPCHDRILSGIYQQ